MKSLNEIRRLVKEIDGIAPTEQALGIFHIHVQQILNRMLEHIAVLEREERKKEAASLDSPR
jgi:hypothetical protein